MGKLTDAGTSVSESEKTNFQTFRTVDTFPLSAERRKIERLGVLGSLKLRGSRCVREENDKKRIKR